MAQEKDSASLTHVVRERDWLRDELARLKAEVAEKEAEMVVRERQQQGEIEDLMVAHSMQECQFFSSPIGGEAHVAGDKSRKELADDPKHWYQRGLGINPENQGTLELAERVQTKAARTHIKYAAVLADQEARDLRDKVRAEARQGVARRTSSVGPSSVLRKTASVGGVEGFFEALFGESDSDVRAAHSKVASTAYTYALSAANMTRKLDASAALAEYDQIIERLTSEETAGDESLLSADALRNLKTQAEKHRNDAENRVKDQNLLLNERMQLQDGEASPATTAPVESFSLKLRTADVRKLGLRYLDGGYEVHLGLPALARVRAAGYANFGRFSPIKPITLDTAGKERSGIPTEATMFAYAFPLHGHEHLDFEPTSAEEEAVIHGAFAYFQNADSLIALKAVSLAQVTCVYTTSTRHARFIHFVRDIRYTHTHRSRPSPSRRRTLASSGCRRVSCPSAAPSSSTRLLRRRRPASRRRRPTPMTRRRCRQRRRSTRRWSTGHGCANS